MFASAVETMGIIHAILQKNTLVRVVRSSSDIKKVQPRIPLANEHKTYMQWRWFILSTLLFHRVCYKYFFYLILIYIIFLPGLVFDKEKNCS